jgi:probable HAF family extracellular repeat protein
VGIINSASDSYGFSYNGSTYTALVDPNALTGSGGTRAFGVNDAGQIVGAYYTPEEYGFFFNGSSYTTLDDPSCGDTVGRGINDSGEIVGSCDNATGQHGFLYNGSTYSLFDDPDAGPFATIALGINNSGQTVGYYINATGEHGFFYDGSTWTTLDDPNASALSAAQWPSDSTAAARLWAPIATRPALNMRLYSTVARTRHSGQIWLLLGSTTVTKSWASTPPYRHRCLSRILIG